MKFFGAFIKKDKNNKIEKIIFIEEGFSWLAFVFSLPWFLFHKMWKSSIALILINSVFIFIKKIELIGQFDFVALQLFLFIAIGFNAGYWLSQHLAKIGYESMGFVLAKNEDEARLEFMKILEENNQNIDFKTFAGIDAKTKTTKKKEPNFA